MIDATPFGCSGLRHLINVGGDIVLSPPRVYGRALAAGSLQKLFIKTRSIVTGLQGPLTSRRALRQGQHLPRASFNFDTVGISPPLVLIEQMRGTALSNDDTQSIPGQDAEDSWGGYCDKVGRLLLPAALCFGTLTCCTLHLLAARWTEPGTPLPWHDMLPASIH